VVFPGFFVLADLARPGGGWRVALGRWRLLLFPLLLALGFAVSVKILLESGRDGVLGHIPDWWGGSYGANLGTALRAASYQALFAAFPFVPSLDWYMDLSRTLLEPCALASGAFLLVLLGLGLRGALAGRGGAAVAGAGVLWAFLGGLLTSQILFPVGIPRADRFLYLSLAGVAAAAAVGFQRVAAVRARAAAVMGLAVVAGLGCIAADRAGAWSDEMTMWHEGPSGGGSPRARAWFIAKRNQVAARTFDRAVEALDAGDAEVAERLLGQAREEFEALIAELTELRAWWWERTGLDVDSSFEARIRRNLSRVHFRSGDYGKALAEAEASVELDAGDARSFALEAIALERLGSIQKAGWRMESALAAAPPVRQFIPGAEEEGPVPPVDAASVLVPVAEWRLSRGLDGAALRALEMAARAYPDPDRNPAVEQAPDLREKIRAKRAAVEAAAAASPRDPALLAAPHHRETLERFPGDAGARLGLARCLDALGRGEEAAELRRLVLADPSSGEDALREAREGLREGGR
jgi:tetratricopeptide (TPR) repeat protein